MFLDLIKNPAESAPQHPPPQHAGGVSQSVLMVVVLLASLFFPSHASWRLSMVHVNKSVSEELEESETQTVLFHILINVCFGLKYVTALQGFKEWQWRLYKRYFHLTLVFKMQFELFSFNLLTCQPVLFVHLFSSVTHPHNLWQAKRASASQTLLCTDVCWHPGHAELYFRIVKT